ncbi:hypothetical protein BDW62DRAFT_178737 [Aspergillus aurantiobrunneus]
MLYNYLRDDELWCGHDSHRHDDIDHGGYHHAQCRSHRYNLDSRYSRLGCRRGLV